MTGADRGMDELNGVETVVAKLRNLKVLVRQGRCNVR